MKRIRRAIRSQLRRILSLKFQERWGLAHSSASIAPLFARVQSLQKEKGQIAVIEVGTRYGESLAYMARHFRISKFLAIDPFGSYGDYAGDDFDIELRHRGEDELYWRLVSLGKTALGSKFSILRTTSDAALPALEPNSWDLIFVDGNHTFDYVLRDLELSWRLLRPGGVLAGHDYFMRSTENGGDYQSEMVYEAVQRFATQRGLSVDTYGTHRGFPMVFSISRPV